MAFNYNSGGAWQYNIYHSPGNADSPQTQYMYYHPGQEPSGTPNSASPPPNWQPAGTSGRGATPPSIWQRPTFSGSSNGATPPSSWQRPTLKVLNPANKKDFTMFTLRNFAAEPQDLTPVALKEMIFEEVGASVVSGKLEFPVGFYNKSAKLWINNTKDVQDALCLLRKNGKLTFWCMGKPESSDHDSCGEDTELTSQPKKRKLTSSEEKASRVNELKAQLRQTHTSKYSTVQYALWAEMIVAGTHESTEEPPPVPMFGAQRPRGRPSTGNLATALTDVADKIASALSPPTLTHSTPTNYASPTKSVELRGKYIQQLKEIVSLRDIGALTDEEYEEQRSVVVNLMRKLPN